MASDQLWLDVAEASAGKTRQHLLGLERRLFREGVHGRRRSV
jgi:hypothetical protein